MTFHTLWPTVKVCLQNIKFAKLCITNYALFHYNRLLFYTREFYSNELVTIEFWYKKRISENLVLSHIRLCRVKLMHNLSLCAWSHLLPGSSLKYLKQERSIDYIIFRGSLQLASMSRHHVSPISATHIRQVGACPRASRWSRSRRCTRRRRTTTPPPLTHTTAAHSHTISSSCTETLKAPDLTEATVLGGSTT